MPVNDNHLVLCPLCGTEYDPWLYDECPRCEDYEIYVDDEDNFAVGGFPNEETDN